MQFTNPIWLWALTGLSIPIGIHLLSRKKGKVIRIGSLRHLQETNTQQFKGIRLNEIILLILRCSLIILFALLISGLCFNRSTNGEEKWIIIERGLEKNREVKSQLDNFQQQGYEAHWLADRFPLLNDSVVSSSPSLYWELLEQLNAQYISDAIIFSKNRIENFNGLRPHLPPNIRWISVPTKSSDYTLNILTMNDSIIVRTGHTSTEKTHFTTQVLSASDWKQSVEPKPIDTIQVTIVSDKLHQYDKKIILAALKTIDESFPVKIITTNSTSNQNNSLADDEWYIWLNDKPISNSVSNKSIYSKPSLNNNIIIQETVNRWMITKQLNEEIALNKNLSIQLAALLIPSKKLFEVASQKDIRMPPDSTVWGENDVSESNLDSSSALSAEAYLLALLLITLLIERMLAYNRNQ